jgi:hypothetical protein
MHMHVVVHGEKVMPAGTPVQVRLRDEERDALDDFRRKKPNPPSRGQAARELIRRALAQCTPAETGVSA